MAHPHLRVRLGILLSLAVLTPAGFAAKLYGFDWLANSAGGALYEIFWVLVFLFIWPTRRALGRIAVAVLIATCIVEVMQLWHQPILESIRSTFMGRMLIGNHFAWSDFLYYPPGAALGWLWGRLLLRARDENDVAS